MCIFEIDTQNLVALKYMVCSEKKKCAPNGCAVPGSIISSFPFLFFRANYKTVPAR